MGSCFFVCVFNSSLSLALLFFFFQTKKKETTYEETLPENKKEFDQNNLQVSNPNTERVALSNGSVEGKLQRAKKRIRDLENQMKQALLKIEQVCEK